MQVVTFHFTFIAPQFRVIEVKELNPQVVVGLKVVKFLKI